MEDIAVVFAFFALRHEVVIGRLVKSGKLGQGEAGFITVINRFLYIFLTLFGIVFVFFQLLGQLTLTITMQLGLVLIFTKRTGDIILVDLIIDIDHYFTERLQKRCQKQ